MRYTDVEWCRYACTRIGVAYMFQICSNSIQTEVRDHGKLTKLEKHRTSNRQSMFGFVWKLRGTKQHPMDYHVPYSSYIIAINWLYTTFSCILPYALSCWWIHESCKHLSKFPKHYVLICFCSFSLRRKHVCLWRQWIGFRENLPPADCPSDVHEAFHLPRWPQWRICQDLRGAASIGLNMYRTPLQIC